ncbi:MAG: DUF5103 domain-containing protein [Bacteroidetes bacterium]|nr:DUF5103 domain-containing protein [Bacteroidota bacterium]
MKKYFFLLMLFLFSMSAAQVTIFGLRVYADNDEYLPPIIMKDIGGITIEFDVITSFAPNLSIQFEHVDRNWQRGKNNLLNDEIKLLARDLRYIAAPNGVQNYTFHFYNSFPNSKNTVQFEYSGNYIFRILDVENNYAVVAEGKFIVVENIVPTNMNIKNTLYPSDASPWNQRLTITVDVSSPKMYVAADNNSVMSQLIKHVDIIENWNIEFPYSIDTDNRSADTFVENYLKPQKQFWIRSVQPGNEYRRLDLSNITKYPNRQTARFADGADVSRVLWQGKQDANGAAKLRPFTGANSDYLDVLMRLTLPKRLEKNIYLVGAFNQWQPDTNYQMLYDSTISQYQRIIRVKRGVYDYQYVTAKYNEQRNIFSDENWFELEGNDWRTINRYTALVYYHDERFGGYDRIIGISTAKNPGGDLGKSINSIRQENSNGVTY